jgi:glycosyltransferase involved in cell wall biosynthesis
MVCVIVPAYNAERTLAGTRESVCAQTYQNLDIIVVDDRSTDGTSTIATEYAARDRRVKVIRQQNAGVAAARNTASSLLIRRDLMDEIGCYVEYLVGYRVADDGMSANAEKMQRSQQLVTYARMMRAACFSKTGFHK